MEGPNVTACLFCDTPMVGVHCKQICPACGYKEDCSDLFPECAYEPKAAPAKPNTNTPPQHGRSS